MLRILWKRLLGEGANKAPQWRRTVVPLAVVLLGLVLAGTVFVLLHNNFSRSVRSSFETAVHTHQRSIQGSIDTYMSSLRKLRSFIEVSQYVSRDEFARFTQPDIKNLPGLLSFSYSPLVRDQDRGSFETILSDEYGKPVVITELKENGEVIKAPRQEVYIPVSRLQPYDTNPSVLGLNTSLRWKGWESLWHAIDTDQLVMTVLGRVVSEQQERLVEGNKGQAIIFGLPIYADNLEHDEIKDPRKQVLGFALAVFDIAGLLESAIENKTEPLGLRLVFSGPGNDNQLVNLHTHHSRQGSEGYRSRMEHRVPLFFENIKWEMMATEANASMYPLWSPLTLPIPLFILVASLALAIYLRNAALREEQDSFLHQQIADRENRYSALVHAIPGAAYTCLPDQDQTMLFISDQIHGLTGYESSEFVEGRARLADLLTEVDLVQNRRLVAEAINSRTEYALEYQLTRSDGDFRWVQERGRAVYGKDGTAKALHGTIQDITERKVSEDRFRDLLESAPDAMLIFDTELRVHAVNHQAELLLSYGREQLVGMTLDGMLAHDDDQTPPTNPFAEHAKGMEAGQRARVFDTHIRDSQGVALPVEVSLSPLRTDQGLRFAAGVRDISQRLELQRQMVIAKNRAEEAAKIKSEFLANMSHEIRTPMNAIIGMSYLVLQTDLTSKQRNFVSKVHASGESLLGIINDILDFSKIEADKMELEKVEFQLEDVLGSLADVVGLKAQEKDIEFLFDIPTDIPNKLMGDPLRLKQVLVNLASNAVKFTDEGSIVVRVRLESSDQELSVLRFAVEDTGIGISDEQRKGLFKAFAQADGSMTRKYGGSGLGLVISENIVKKMNGSIGVASEPGLGSTFYFDAQFNMPDNVENEVVNELPESLDGVNVLIVDDNSAAREIFFNLLESTGAIPQAVSSGEQALKVIRSDNEPHLVLMDWKMPGLDGIETTRRLQSECPEIPIIMVTAFDHVEFTNDLKGAHLEAVLSKPVMPSALFKAMTQALNRSGGKQLVSQPQVDTTTSKAFDGAGIRLLLVEDNLLNQELALELLTSTGICVDVANNGQEALDILEDHHYDGVLMDCQMPIMDGYTATERIRANKRYSDLPIIAMTADVMVSSQERALASGMNAIIGKPIILDNLYQVLNRWVVENKSEQAQANAGSPTAIGGPRLGAAIPGVDISTALGRLNGKQSLFNRLLDGYVCQHDEFVKEFTESLNDDKDPNAAQRHAHSLKGLAATIGADEVSRAAERLEQACVHKQSKPQILKLFQQVVDLSRSVVEGINPYLKSQEGATDAQVLNVDEKSIESLLNDLQGYLENNDTDAELVIDKLEECLHGDKGSKLLVNLRKSMDLFDFTGAIEKLAEVREALGFLRR